MNAHQPTGFVALVLHAHLPFVRHVAHSDALEERWLFEAVAECYVPLLAMLERLEAEGIPFRLTLSLSPTLMAMLDDPLLRSRCRRHLEAVIDLADREVAQAAGGPEALPAHFHRHHYRWVRRLYVERYQQDLVEAFHRLAKAGYLELITCSATHGFLPLFQHQPTSVRAQVLVAVEEFRRRFGHPPRGFWLPECGYFPGVDRILRDAGVQFCFLETHGITHARPAPPRGCFCHGWTPGGLAVFGRDVPSSRQVWSATEGYPGDPWYREFHWDIGFHRPAEHLGSLAGPSGSGAFTGLKYWRVTGPTHQKAYYDRHRAEETAARHAAHFLHRMQHHLAVVAGLLDGGPPPVAVAPYDAELFGHWWFEGPIFLEHLARLAARQSEIRFITPGDYLDLYPWGQGPVEPTFSSWGEMGYADYWCCTENHWVYRPLHQAGRRMAHMARRFSLAHGPVQEALNQAARELLLAQSSDWTFLMRAGTAAEYARRRLTQHLERFATLASHVEEGSPLPDDGWLSAVQEEDNLFPTLQYQVFHPV